MNAATASEVKDDHQSKPNDRKGAQDTANKNAPAAMPVAPARKPLGTKEVIPFAWKVIGLSGEMVLTLFKSIEKEDSEAHLARLGKDGAYKNLRLVEADFKIVQPKSVRAVLAANVEKAKTIATPKKGKKKKARVTIATIKLATKKTTTSATKKTKKAKTAKKVKKAVLASTTKKKKVKKAAKKSTSRTVKAKKSAKQAVKKKTKTKSSKKKTKAKKK
ncbi:MAG: hypothetical protein IIC51_03125 [Planctomycetes bacterium]|nr:hypothetical protein [Planctomycetota bacterium]